MSESSGVRENWQKAPLTASNVLRITIGVSALALIVACGSMDESSDSVAFAGPTSGNGGTSNGSTGAAGGGNGVPMETEQESSYLAPAVSGNRVFSVNPGSGRVAVIDTNTLEIILANAGFAPTHAVALPREAGMDRALVLNAGSNDASYLKVSEQGEVTTQRIATHAGANSVNVSTDGHWAVVWTDYRKVLNIDPTDGFQDITVIRLTSGESTRLTVGFRPVGIAVNGELGVVYVSAEPGIDVIDLQGSTPQITHAIEFADNVAGAPVSEDVSFTADTRFAFLRYRDKAELSILDLQRERWSTVPVSGLLTDLDLSEDGTLAVAVVRDPVGAQVFATTDAGGLSDDVGSSDSGGTPLVMADAAVDAGPSEGGVGADSGTIGEPVDAGSGLQEPGSDAAPGAVVTPGSQVIVFRLGSEPGLIDPQIIAVPGEFFGSVSVARDGSAVVLFTTAIASDRITLLDLESEEHRTVSVKSPVLAVVIADDAEHAISLQGPAPNEEGVVGKKGAFSLISLKAVRAPKIVATDAPAVNVAIMPGSPSYSALVTVSDSSAGVFATYNVGFPSLTADAIRLASEPLATGVVAASQLGFVAQKHPEGRLTLVNFETGVPRTLTGFELAAKVVE